MYGEPTRGEKSHIPYTPSSSNSPFNSPKPTSLPKGSSSTRASLRNDENASGSSDDASPDRVDPAGGGAGAWAAAARFRRAATEFEASFFPSVALVGS